jgi:hypothetical protein
MKKFKLLWIVYALMLIVTMWSASAVSQDDLLDGLVSYWKFDETSGTTADDSHGSYDFTHTDTGLITSGGKIDYGLSFTSNNYHSVNSNPVIPYGAKSISVWVYYVSNSANQYFLVNNGGSGGNNGMSLAVTSSHKLRWEISRSDVIGWNFQFNSATSLSNNAWNHVIVTWDGSTSSNSAKIYINGELDASQTPLDTETASGTNNLLLGRYNPASSDQSMNGRLDEVGIWNRALNSTEVSALYDIQKDGYTNGTYNFSALSDEPVVSNFSVSVTDEWTGGNVNNISVVVDGETYTNTTGNTITTNLLNNDTSTYLVQISAENYFSKNYSDVDVSSNLNAELYQSIISFDAYEIITNNSITNFNITIDSTPQTQAGTWYLSAGEYTALIESTGYYAKNHTFNATALTTETVSVELHDAELTIFAKNAWSNANLSNFSGWISNTNYSYNETFNTTTGEITLPLKKDLNYTVFVESPNYGFSTETNYKNLTLTSNATNTTFGLYTENSIRVIIKDEATGNSITTNTTILVTSDIYEETFSTTSGTYLIENLTDDVYELRFTVADYTDRLYSVTVTEGSTQTLTAFLTSTTDTVIFTVLDDSSGNAIEGARVSMYALIDAQWVTVESKLTDITGKVQLLYSKNRRYKFVVSDDDYISKTFELNPVLFDNYNVRLVKTDVFPDILQGFTASVDFTPRYFFEGNNNLTLFFNSPEGRLAEYGFIINYPGSSFEYNNTNAIGETYTVNFDIVDPEFLDTVNLTYYYRLVGGEMQYRTFNLPILDVAPDLSFADLRNNDYGLSTFEKLLIVTLTILLVGGLVLLTAGSVVGGAVVVLLLAWFGFLGFIPVWSLAIVILAGITYLTSKGV